MLDSNTVGAVRADAGAITRGRKVRAPQGRVLANGQPRRLAGQRHREQTAGRKAGKGETVRQERTAPPVTAAARQAPPGARANRGAPLRAATVARRAPGYARSRPAATRVLEECPPP